MRRVCLCCMGILLVLTLALPTLSASTSGTVNDDERDKEIEQLKALVKELSERIERLEQDQSTEPSAAKKKAVTVKEVQSQDVEKLKKAQSRTNRRLLQVERNQGLDRIRFTGDYRFEAHSINGSVPDHFDGMRMQNLMVDTMFYAGATGMFPQDLDQVGNVIRDNYSDYQYFTDNLTFEQLKGAVGGMPAEQQGQLFSFLMPNTRVNQYDANNPILYTNRLRLQMDARVGSNIGFTGRLGMYKVFGDSTGVQVFNGQATSMNIDGTTVGVPNSDILRVERAYFSWANIADQPMYLSIGRRPSTHGAPLNYRLDEPRGGTPAGSVIDFQFDGITFGYHLGEHSTFRLCYGLGYESGFGNGALLKLPQDRLKDSHFFGVNWDVWKSDDMFVQGTFARAFNVTDGFNGLVVLPNNPLTGQPIGAPLVMRFSPSSNLGGINLGSLVLTRRDGAFDYFVSGNLSNSDPDPVTTPFGGLFSDPFETPKSQTGGMIYAGTRWSSASERTKIGFEYNYGSKYWFNFAHAEDDIIAPKTAARGHVFETYLTHRIQRRFIFKINYQHYDYIYSGSGWHLGAPKRLDEMPLLGFPGYDRVDKLAVGITARF